MSRKTVQRLLQDGKVVWRGDVRTGSKARGIDLAELRKALSTPAAGGRITDRTKTRPFADTVQGSLEECARDLAKNEPSEKASAAGLPKRVLSVFAAAAENGADLDFLLFCIEQLKEGNQSFVLLVLGLKMPPHVCESLIEFAAVRLRELAGGREIDADKYSFIGWWRAFTKRCVQARVAAKPAIVTARADNGSRTTLELVPSWLEDAPRGVLPIEGGHHSVATVRWERGQKDVVNRTAAKVAARLGDSEASMQTARLAALLDLKDDEYLVYTKKWNWICDVADGNLLVQELSDRPLPGEQEEGVRRVYEVLKGVSESLGLSIREARSLLRAWRRLSPDASPRATQVFNDNVAVGQQCPFKVNSRTVVAKAFGVSRGTLAKWIRDSGMGSTTAGRKRKAANTEDLCSVGVGDSEEADDQDAPEGGQQNTITGPVDVVEIERMLYPEGRDDD